MRDRYEEGERARKRRRSHSPRHKADRRRHHDYESEHRSRRERSIDHPRDRDTRHKSRKDRSPERKASRQSSVDIQVSRRSNGPLPSQATAFENGDSTALVVSGDKALPEKEKPNFTATGLLAAASNSVAAADGTSIVLKYHEPPEARKPAAKDIWKLFVFKGSDIVETIELGLRSCWLVGRELAVVDMPAEHPSISKQHAVIQFRYIEKRNEFGDKLGKVRPYLIDLDSANGTLLNNEQVEASRYFELRDKDMIQFGHSTREYVLMLSPKD
ncbi:SMAD/FHA domain-containing protein [Bisporella sp. PMI_857]|nr:SMAD/FHA domain-containing protein [Bisporella sp. PMI_857]